MTEFNEDALQNTGEVMLELTAKAGDARRTGQSRRSFFQHTAKLAGATALGVAGARLMQPIAAEAATKTPPNTDTVQGIIDIAATAEALAVTFYYECLKAGQALPNVNSTANQNYFQAAVIQEFEHLLYLEKLGAHSVTSEFYFPPNMFTDESVFFPTALLLESYFISAYLAAAIDFSGAVSSGITTAAPTFVGFAVQVLGVECEHRALLGVAANISPPNGLIVETALLSNVNEAVPPLTPFLDGSGGFVGPIKMPSRSAVNKIAQPYGFSFFPKFEIV